MNDFEIENALETNNFFIIPSPFKKYKPSAYRSGLLVQKYKEEYIKKHNNKNYYNGNKENSNLKNREKVKRLCEIKTILNILNINTNLLSLIKFNLMLS